jgi:hypothetical protein
MLHGYRPGGNHTAIPSTWSSAIAASTAPNGMASRTVAAKKTDRARAGRCAGACHQLELAKRRGHRWLVRLARGGLADAAPGGSPMHGLLDAEAEEVLALFDEWGEVDWSHRKLAHRGSYLGRGVGVTVVGAQGTCPC